MKGISNGDIFYVTPIHITVCGHETLSVLGGDEEYHEEVT
jgi:hypothetical protein